jgi:hypothetical protein
MRMYKPNLTFGTEVLLSDFIVTGIMPKWDTLVEEIHKAEKFFEDNNLTKADAKTNVMSDYNTPFRSHQHTNFLDNLHACIKKEIFQAQNDYRGMNQTSIKNYLTVGESWILKYKAGEATQKHSHYPYHLVSTFYYDVEKSTPIVFEYYDLEGLQQKEIEVSNGMFIIQNGAVSHSVPTVRGSRSVVATNWFYDISKFIEDTKNNT